MDLLTCTISVYEFLKESDIVLSAKKEKVMYENLILLGFDTVYSFNDFLKEKLNIPLPYESDKYLRYEFFYEDCISILERNEKINKILNNI